MAEAIQSGAAAALYTQNEAAPKKTQNSAPARAEAQRVKTESPEARLNARETATGYARRGEIANAGIPKPDYTEYGAKNAESALDKAVDEANKKIMGYNKEFEYSVHKITKDIMIKVIDTETEEVIREIPPQKALDAIAAMWELAGLLVDEKR